MKVQILTTCLSTFALFGCFTTYAQTNCLPLQETDKAKLIDYVQKKYKTPASVHVEIAGAEFVGSTCYRKLQFKTKDPRSTFRLELFAAPDLRFLTRELLDSAVDPIVEESRKAEALAISLTDKNAPSRGNGDAPVTIAVFSDFQCPYCARFAAVMNDVMETDSDKVRLVFHHFPLSMHPWARTAAEGATCAQEQGNGYFWALHDYMFDHQKEITPNTLQSKLAEVTNALAGFDQGKFAMCLIEKKTGPQIDQAVAFAQQNGINATPTVFVNGQKTQISAPEQLRTLIRQLTAKTAAPSSMNPREQAAGK